MNIQQVFSVLSNDNRLELFMAIYNNTANCSMDLQKELRLSQGYISSATTALVNIGLVGVKREGVKKTFFVTKGFATNLARMIEKQLLIKN